MTDMKTTIAILLLALASPLLATPDGAALFKTNCAICHGPDGRAQTPAGKSMKVRDLTSAEVQKLSDAELTAIISYGKGKMPSYKARLGPDDIKQLIAHIRAFKK